MGARGELCTERGFNPAPIDYDSGLSDVSIALFYHTTDEEKRRMFPIDPELADTRTLTSCGTSMHRADFRDDVEDRDESCVVTGAPSLMCQATHLLPHSKGDTVWDSLRHYSRLQSHRWQYIETLSTHRRRDSSSDDDIVLHIDDVRNGVFLGSNLHQVLGQHLAFLKVRLFGLMLHMVIS
jgi:hypothetical protein